MKMNAVSMGVILGGYDGFAYPPPTLKRYKRPSFELKLRRNACAAGAPARTLLGELTALPRPLSSIKGSTSKGEGDERWSEGEGKRGKGRGSGTPHFWEKVTPLAVSSGRLTQLDLLLDS